MLLPLSWEKIRNTKDHLFRDDPILFAKTKSLILELVHVYSVGYYIRWQTHAHACRVVKIVVRMGNNLELLMFGPEDSEKVLVRPHVVHANKGYALGRLDVLRPANNYRPIAERIAVDMQVIRSYGIDLREETQLAIGRLFDRHAVVANLLTRIPGKYMTFDSKIMRHRFGNLLNNPLRASHMEWDCMIDSDNKLHRFSIGEKAECQIVFTTEGPQQAAVAAGKPFFSSIWRKTSDDCSGSSAPFWDSCLASDGAGV